MKRAIIAIILVFVSICPTWAQDVPTMAYGYCGDIAHSIGMYGRNVAYQGGMCIDAETATAYEGCLLTAVMIGTGTAAWKEAKINLSYDLDEAPFYQQDISVQTEQWNTITLDQPYTLEAGKTFYVYYTLKAGENARDRWCPIATDDGPANSKGDFWGYAQSAEDLKWKHLADENYGNICLKVVLQGVSLTRYDLAVDEITTSGFVKPATPFSVEVAVRNLAAETVTSLDLTYQIGDNEAVTKTFDANLPNNRTAYFTLSDLVINEEGEWPLKVTVSSPNGEQDEFTDNDTRTIRLRCSSQLVSRRLLIEQFTTARCVNCPAGHERIEEGLAGDDRIIYVAHHAGFGTDRFTLPQSTTYLSLYGSDNTYAPAIMYDRTCLYGEGASDKGTPVSTIGTPEMVRHLADVRLAEPAVVTLDLDYRVVNGKIVVQVKGESLINLSEARVNVYLTENGLFAPQEGADNPFEYRHNHVLRSVLTSTWGNSLSAYDGKFVTTVSADINPEWILDNMEVVAFVTHMNFSDPCDCAVYNAESKRIEADHIGNIDGIECHVISPDSAPVYNLMGQRVTSTGKGIYITGGKKVIR